MWTLLFLVFQTLLTVLWDIFVSYITISKTLICIGKCPSINQSINQSINHSINQQLFKHMLSQHRHKQHTMPMKLLGNHVVNRQH